MNSKWDQLLDCHPEPSREQARMQSGTLMASYSPSLGGAVTSSLISLEAALTMTAVWSAPGMVRNTT
jgi:hypothetical protein